MCKHNEQNTCVKSIQKLIHSCVPETNMKIFNMLIDFIHNLNSQYCESDNHVRTLLLNGSFTADGHTCITKSMYRVSRLDFTRLYNSGTNNLLNYYRLPIVRNHY